MNIKKFSFLSAILLSSAGLITSCNTKKDYPVEEGATTITVFVRDHQEWSNNNLYERVKTFNSDLTDGIQVEVKFILESEFNDKITAAREAGKAPDIYLSAYNQIYTNWQLGNCMAINDLFTPEQFALINPTVKDAVCFDGNYYAYPYFIEPSSMLFYSKKAFQAAGVAEPDPKKGWTWEDWMDACAKIKPTLQTNQFTLGMSPSSEMGWTTWGMVYNQLNSWPITDNWDACVLSNKRAEFSALLELFDNIYTKGYSPVQSICKGYDFIIEPFCEGRFAMTVGPSFSIGTIVNEYPEVYDDVGLIPLPTSDGDINRASATNGGWCYQVDAQCKHTEEVSKFLQWLLCPTDMTSIASFFEASGYSKFPANTAVAEYVKNQIPSDNKFYETIEHVANHAVLEPIYTYDISMEIQGALETMIVGMPDGQTYEKLTVSTSGKINQIIKNQNLAGKNPHYKG